MIIGCMGRPGCGKTTWLASMAVINDKRLRKNAWLEKHHFPKWLRYPCYDQIYSTEPITGCIIIKPADVGAFKPLPNSAFLLAEAGCDFSNRMFKSIPKYSTDFFAQHRHYSCDIFFESQSVDVDKKLRDRCAILYIMRKSRIFSGISFMQRVRYDVDIDEVTHDLVDAYYVAKGIWRPLSYLFGSSKIFYRRPFYHAFDTYHQGLVFTRPAPVARYGDLMPDKEVKSDNGSADRTSDPGQPGPH